MAFRDETPLTGRNITVTLFRPLTAFTPRVVSSVLCEPLWHSTRSLWLLASGLRRLPHDPADHRLTVTVSPPERTPYG